MRHRAAAPDEPGAAVHPLRDEHDLRVILDAIPVPIFFKDATGAYRGCNRAFEEYLGRPRERILGRIVEDVAPPELAAVYREADDALFRDRGEQVYEAAVRFADGSLREVLFNKATFLGAGGELGGLVGTMLDITERKQAERALRESERRLSLVLEAVQEGFWDWDLARGEVRLSRHFGDLLGRAVGETVRLDALAALVHPEDLGRVRAAVEEHLAGREPRLEVEHRVLASGGQVKWVVTRGQVVERGRSGVPSRAVGACRDVTDRKKMQLHVLMSDRLASLGTLAAGIAHEVNNPLASVAANVAFVREVLAELAAGGAGRATVAELLAALDESAEGCARAASIVKGLGTFARSDEERGPACLEKVLASALRLAAPELKRRARLKLDLPPLPLVQGSDARLGQVFLNLFLNADHAIPEGKPEEHEVHVLARPPVDGMVAVEVRDTGAGIPPEIVPRIFDPFFTTKPIGMGSGLGLWICQGIVTAAGGEIEVSSTVGQGSVFRVLLPVAA